MSKLEKKKTQLVEIEKKTTDIQQQYIDALDNDPKYSLEVDPENKYNMSDVQKEFIKQYVEFKNVNTAAELSGIDMDTAKQFFVAYSSQQEIRRINLALYHRQFASRLITLDEIGGYLTCLLTGENVPLGEQLKTSEKLKVVDQLIKLNELKKESLEDPSRIMWQDLDLQIKALSVATISQLLEQSNKIKEKNSIVYEYDSDGSLSPEEKAYLSTLSTKDILQLIDKTNKGDDSGDSK